MEHFVCQQKKKILLSKYCILYSNAWNVFFFWFLYFLIEVEKTGLFYAFLRYNFHQVSLSNRSITYSICNVCNVYSTVWCTETLNFQTFISTKLNIHSSTLISVIHFSVVIHLVCLSVFNTLDGPISGTALHPVWTLHAHFFRWHIGTD